VEKDKALPVKYLDVRTVDRYVRRGLVDEKERARLLKALPDLAESSAKVETEFDGSGELGPAS
jgi:aromatic ring hydroxylase